MDGIRNRVETSLECVDFFLRRLFLIGFMGFFGSGYRARGTKVADKLAADRVARP